MTRAAQGGRSKQAPTRAATKAPARAATKAPARAATKAPAARTKKPAAKQRARASASRAARPLTGEESFAKVRELCLALPDTVLTMTWGSPHFRVANKIFCGFGVEDGKPVMGVKLGLSHARAIVKEPRFWPAPYVGKHGWVSMDVARRKSWGEVEALIRESYALIAPKASLKKLR